MCFGDGVQYATGCTLGKGNLEKTPYGKLAVTVIERATNRAIRVSYKPTLQKQIGASAFMTKRGQGIEPDRHPGGRADGTGGPDLECPGGGHPDARRGLRSSSATGYRRSWASSPVPPAGS